VGLTGESPEGVIMSKDYALELWRETAVGDHVTLLIGIVAWLILPGSRKELWVIGRNSPFCGMFSWLNI
jgi:hypothetical protein